MKRRTFLKISSGAVIGSLAGTSGLLAWIPRAYASTVEATCYITEGYIEQPDGTNVYFRGFSRSVSSLNVPGESIIAQEGDTVNVTIINTLGSNHRFSVEGHGVDVSIPAGSQKTVSFTAGRPGSYFYYDNSNAPYNRLVGLHGGLAVMPKGISNEVYVGSPTFVKQQFWIFHDIDPIWHSRIRDGRTPGTRYSPRYFTLNGLSGRPPGAPGAMNPDIDSMYDPRSQLKGRIGDRTLLRVMNSGLCQQSVHCHGNHVEWLTDNGNIRPDVWSKDCIYLEGNMGKCDLIYPFERFPDAYPRTSKGKYPMHLHTEMSQTAGGGLYMFGAITEIIFE